MESFASSDRKHFQEKQDWLAMGMGKKGQSHYSGEGGTIEVGGGGGSKLGGGGGRTRWQG